MLRSTTALIGISAILLGAAAHAGDLGVETTIATFGAAFNKGDVVAAKAMMVPAASIVDEVAPFGWGGPAAFDTWLSDLSKSEAAEGKTGGVVAISAPSRELIAGDRAYAVAPATYTFKQKGTLMRETAQITFVMAKTSDGWKIAGFTWTGPDPVPLR